MSREPLSGGGPGRGCRAVLRQEPLPATCSLAIPGSGAAPAALGCAWVCSLRCKAVVAAPLLPGPQPTHRFAPSLLCATLCGRALEARRAASPRRAPPSGTCLCFPSLCEPVSVPVLVRAGRACSSLVPVLLLCCLRAGKQLVLPPCLPASPSAPCAAPSRGSWAFAFACDSECVAWQGISR